MVVNIKLTKSITRLRRVTNYHFYYDVYVINLRLFENIRW